VQNTARGGRFKTFNDSVRVIGKLGQRLVALQADVVAIKGLPVDDNGDAEAIVNATQSRSLHVLRIPPAAMLLAKRGEVVRVITALRAEFSEIMDHAEVLTARCKPQLPAELAAPRRAIDLFVLERMSPDAHEEAKMAPQRPQPSHNPDRNRSPALPPHPGVA
jgi:hypothetical protein